MRWKRQDAARSFEVKWKCSAARRRSFVTAGPREPQPTALHCSYSFFILLPLTAANRGINQTENQSSRPLKSHLKYTRSFFRLPTTCDRAASSCLRHPKSPPPGRRFHETTSCANHTQLAILSELAPKQTHTALRPSANIWLWPAWTM